jgi:sugar transferase (PEP-CTERM/EpsH1 system associated)
MRILVITNHLPHPPNRGTPIRNYNLLKRLAGEHEVWVASFGNVNEEAESISHLMTFCKGVITAETRETSAFDRPLEAVRYQLRGRPFELRHFHSRELIEKINKLVSEIEFDIVDIVDSHMGLYLEELPVELQKRTVLTFIDVIFDKFKRISRYEPKLRRKIRAWVYSFTMRFWEPYFAERFTHSIAVSPSDRDLLLSVNPRLKISVVPNGIDTKQFQPLPRAKGKPALVFVGNMEYLPNVDAVKYFYQDVYPKIRAAIPGIELWIVGHDPAQEVKDLASEDIFVTGSVDNVLPYYERSMVSIVPLRAGGGTRLKILESMALGRPVVSTSIGCEGLDVVDGEHLFIANTPDVFAEKTIRLVREEELSKKMIELGRKLAVSRYDWDVISEQLLHTYKKVIRESRS